jgi:hypothetical protein
VKKKIETNLNILKIIIEKLCSFIGAVVGVVVIGAVVGVVVIGAVVEVVGDDIGDFVGDDNGDVVGDDICDVVGVESSHGSPAKYVGSINGVGGRDCPALLLGCSLLYSSLSAKARQSLAAYSGHG